MLALAYDNSRSISPITILLSVHYLNYCHYHAEHLKAAISSTLIQTIAAVTFARHDTCKHRRDPSTCASAMEDQTARAAEYEDEAHLNRDFPNLYRHRSKARSGSPDSDASKPLLDRASTFGERDEERRETSYDQPWKSGHEGLPWTRRPSVGEPVDNKRQLANLSSYRFSGSCRHSSPFV